MVKWDTAATTNTDIIKEWWTNYPSANVGIATGPSGLLVVDVDPKNGGDETLQSLIIENGVKWTYTYTVKTGSGGWHFYFTNTDKLGNSTGKLGNGIDTRGIGGYVIAPPSNHASGGRYAIIGATDTPRAPPEFITKQLLADKFQPKGAVPKEIIGGGRNATLASMAGTMHRRGFVKTAISAALHEQNFMACKPPLRESEVDQIIESVTRYPVILNT